LASGHAHAFVLLSIVIVTHPMSKKAQRQDETVLRFNFYSILNNFPILSRAGQRETFDQ